MTPLRNAILLTSLSIMMVGCSTTPQVDPIVTKKKPAISEPIAPQPEKPIEPVKPKVSLFEGSSRDYLLELYIHDKMVIFYHRGGIIKHAEQAIVHHTDTGKTSHVPGTCVSACTLMIGAPWFSWSCGSVFKFHAAGIYDSYGDIIMDQETTEYISGIYPPKLRLHLETVGALDSLDLYSIRGEAISDLTDQVCLSSN